MARLARVVVAGLPHHITQRGNRRQPVFFEDGDYRLYLGLIGAAARRSGTAVWSYCLMPDHVHFIMAPSHPDGLRATFAEAHRRYTRHINARFGWTGHLWQGRFASSAMDPHHLMAALRYVAFNPVRAQLVASAVDWPWSSTRAHVAGQADGLVEVAAVLELTGDFAEFLGEAPDPEPVASLRRAYSTGRPVGAQDWIAALEAQAGRVLAPARRGPKPRPA
ncbi:transposase [Phenylobacterium sp.]|uniref:transposase n=1 Tax=Phenylobacterium sp. TaxID=1871053 RepID=UPI0025CDE577|nr:transposase [Phenylobacterium sp.]